MRFLHLSWFSILDDLRAAGAYLLAASPTLTADARVG